MSRSSSLLTLPVELVGAILSELDLSSLINATGVCRLLRNVASDPILNPWRRPIDSALQSPPYESALKNLSVHSVVPRHNWIEILTRAAAEFILFEAVLPNLRDQEWEECFSRRFLPGWKKWKRDGRWKEAFMKALWRVWHRLNSTCTADEAWTNYVILYRNGSATSQASSSRTFNPMALYNVLKGQDTAHLETQVRLVVQFADVRILAFGTLHHPDSFYRNPNAKAFLHPPGVENVNSENSNDSPEEFRSEGHEIAQQERVSVPLNRSATLPSPSLHFHPITRTLSGEASQQSPPSEGWRMLRRLLFSGAAGSAASPPPPPRVPTPPSETILGFTAKTDPSPYRILKYPQPIKEHARYPNHTPGGGDLRWKGEGELEEGGKVWVGPLLLTAQLVPHSASPLDIEDGENLLSRHGSGRNQWASFGWDDLCAVGYWMEERVRKADPGNVLGNA